MKKFILASASPRRRELLEQIGLDFDILVANADEKGIDKNLPPKVYTCELAVLKASACCKVLIEKAQKNNYVIAADTIVYLDNTILGKPKDEEDAKRILKKLSGREHEVYTGVCIMRTKDGFGVSKSVKTTVKFKDLSDIEIDKYIKTGEPMDKAGAYGIQGLGSVFVEEIKGDYFNVVGLPLGEVYKILNEEFNIGVLN